MSSKDISNQNHPIQNTENKELFLPKNFSKRLELMRAGLNELENWLSDTISQGLASLESQPYSLWKEISARMVDAKLGGISKQILSIQQLITSEERYPEKVLEALTAYYLLIKGLRKLEQLPTAIQYDLLSYAGITPRKEALLKHGNIVHDAWMVLGKEEGIEDKLNYRKTWLLGYQTRRYGLILDYSFGNTPYNEDYTVGGVFEGDAVFYPSNAPLRIIMKDINELERKVRRIVGYPNLNDFLIAYADNLANNLWQINFPCSIENLLPAFEKQQLVLVDTNENTIPVICNAAKKWTILAMSGGHPINIFGIWKGNGLIPLSLSINKKFVSLQEYT